MSYQIPMLYNFIPFLNCNVTLQSIKHHHKTFEALMGEILFCERLTILYKSCHAREDPSSAMFLFQFLNGARVASTLGNFNQQQYFNDLLKLQQIYINVTTPSQKKLCITFGSKKIPKKFKFVTKILCFQKIISPC